MIALDAVEDALPALRTALGHAAADQLLLSPGHQALSRVTPADYGALAYPIHPEIRVLGRAVATQSADLAATLRSMANSLEHLRDLLTRPGTATHLVVVDTNVYLHADPTDPGGNRSVTGLPWRDMLTTGSHGPPVTGHLTVVLPDFVVTELDLRKSRGDNSARRRAREVLRDLHRLLTAAATFPTATLEPESHDHAGDGIDLVFLDTGTITGPHPADVDQALIDLAEQCRAFTDLPVHFVTGDLSADLRAQTRAAGPGTTQTLIAHWLDWNL